MYLVLDPLSDRNLSRQNKLRRRHSHLYLDKYCDGKDQENYKRLYIKLLLVKSSLTD